MLILANTLWDYFGFDFDKFSDVSVYSVMALTATLLFVIKLALMLLSGDDGGDFDLDVDGADVGHADSDAAFSAFSLLSILAFFMGAGWMGLACRQSWELNSLISAFLACAFGAAMMMIASGGMFYMRKLGKERSYDARSAIGKTGRIYMTVPAKGEGEGKVEVDVSGQRKIMRAVSTGRAIDAFTSVRIIDVRDDETMIIEPSA